MHTHTLKYITIRFLQHRFCTFIPTLSMRIGSSISTANLVVKTSDCSFIFLIFCFNQLLKPKSPEKKKKYSFILLDEDNDHCYSRHSHVRSIHTHTNFLQQTYRKYLYGSFMMENGLLMIGFDSSNEKSSNKTPQFIFFLF